MATSSFYEMMEIDSQEKADRLVEAFEIAEKRGPLKIEGDFDEMLEEGRKWLEEHA